MHAVNFQKSRKIDKKVYYYYLYLSPVRRAITIIYLQQIKFQAI